MKILIVEDEAALAADMRTWLNGAGFVCETADTWAEASEKIWLYEYDCVLLDIGLPGGNGLHLIREIKERSTPTGIIVISARTAVDDRVQGLDLGADDYLTKPFHLSELQSRIRSLLRRRLQQGSALLTCCEITVDTQAQEALVNGKVLDLTRKEISLLIYFLTSGGRLLTRAAIATHLWGDEMDSADSYDFLYTHIKNLRRKLVAAGAGDYIRSVYGTGYKWEAVCGS